ncbi:unnamed protein product, partial [Choristocarpus tenellus]
IPSVTWKAERARRGIIGGAQGTDFHREIEKAAQDMANEAIRPPSPAHAARGTHGCISLGKTVFKGEKFFWRTQDLIQVVIQLNAKEGFIAVSTFDTAKQEAYPWNVICLYRTFSLKKGARTPPHSHGSFAQALGAQSKRHHEEAHMGYISDYLLNHLCMPDMYGNLLQPDLLQPEVPVNPGLPTGTEGGEGKEIESAAGKFAAEHRPGMMRTTFDKWDTLLLANPPENIVDQPDFTKSQKRHSYYEQFLAKQAEFKANSINAHRLSSEAIGYVNEVM